MYGCTTCDTAKIRKKGISFQEGQTAIVAECNEKVDLPVHAAICSKHFVGDEKVHVVMHTCQGALCVRHLLDFIFLMGKRV